MSDKESATSEHQCRHLTNCIVWNKFSTNSKLFWINSYCRGPKESQCARKQEKARNGIVSDELLPNGAYLNATDTTGAPAATTVALAPECENLKKCAVWSQFNSDIKMVWIKAYCQGPKKNDCVRKQRSSEGVNVPENMLPNGDIL